MKKHIPNILTVARIIVVPLIVASMYLPDNLRYIIPATLFFFAGVSDLLDGYLARKWQVESSFGTMLDPIADKLLTGAVIVMVVWSGQAEVLPAVIIICREMLISGLREHLARINCKMPVSFLAKLKTTIQFVAMGFLIGYPATNPDLYYDEAASLLFWFAALLTMATGYAYIHESVRFIKADNTAAVIDPQKYRSTEMLGLAISIAIILPLYFFV